MLTNISEWLSDVIKWLKNRKRLETDRKLQIQVNKWIRIGNKLMIVRNISSYTSLIISFYIPYHICHGMEFIPCMTPCIAHFWVFVYRTVISSYSLGSNVLVLSVAAGQGLRHILVRCSIDCLAKFFYHNIPMRWSDMDRHSWIIGNEMQWCVM